MSPSSDLQTLLSELHSTPLSSRDHLTTLLSRAKLLLLKLNCLLPQPSSPPQTLSLARQTLETGALLSIRLKDSDAFTRYYQQLLPFYDLPPESFDSKSHGQKAKVTGLYLLLLLTKGDYAGFHTVVEGLDEELEASQEVQYSVRLERWLMEGSYDKVWGAMDREGRPAEEFGVFSEVLIDTIRAEIASCSERAYPSLPVPNAKNLLFLDSEGSVVNFAKERGWEVKDGRIWFPDLDAEGEKGGAMESEKVIENTIGYARELEMIV